MTQQFSNDNMQPFSVTCETCGARLKVRDESVVGEIHACPKCASMVLIALPATGFKTTPPVTAVPRPLEQPQATDVALPGLADFSTEVDQLLQQGAMADSSQAIDSTASKVAVDITTAGTGSSVLLWSVVTATSLAVLSLGAILWRFTSRDPSPTSVATANASQVVADGEGTVEPIASVTDENVVAHGDVSAHDKAGLSGADKPGGSTSQTGDAQKPQIPTVEQLPELPPVTPSESPEKKPSEAQREETAPAIEIPTSLPQLIDPLGINPADLDLLLIPKGSQPPTPPPAEQPAEQPVSAPLNQPLPQPNQARKFDPGSAAIGPSFAEQFAPAPLPVRMSARIPSVRWSGAPLNRVLSELTQLSGITIGIDPETLRMAQVRADHKITLAQQDVPFESIIQQLAETLRLEVTVLDDQILLTKANADVSREVAYRVDDLAPDPPAVKDLQNVIEQFVLNAPEQASMEGEGGQIVIAQPARYQYDVLLFLERLRKARGLAPRSKYPTNLVDAEPLLVSLDTQLSRNTTFAIVDWTPLADVFDYWQESSGIALLIDWRELATIDRRPLSTMAASADQLSWDLALDACLTPVDLAWIPVDGQTLQITTHTAARKFRWVDMYALDELQQLPPRLRNAAGLRDALADRCDPESLADAVIADDASGKLILVRGNREVHKAVFSMRDDS